MTGTKIVIIVLVVIAVLFVVLMVWGSGNNSGKTFDKNKPGSFLSWLGQLGGSSFDIKQLQPKVTSKTFDLARTPKFDFKVAADSDHPFRQATFTVQPASCAQVLFTDPSTDQSPGCPSDDPKKQPSKLQSPQSSHCAKDQNKFTITIPKGGGELTIARTVASSTASCTVTLE